MKDRCRFRPSLADELESRVALSHAPTRATSAIVSGLYPRLQNLTVHQQPIVAQVNRAFASFVQDYGQARAIYFASMPNGTGLGTGMMMGDPAYAAFQQYTQQRVNLLGQQLISGLLQTSLSTTRPRGGEPTIVQFIGRRIYNPNVNINNANLAAAAAAGAVPNYSLLRTLWDSTPLAGTPRSTATLYSLAQDNAIEAARVGVINGVNILKNGDFGNNTHRHK